jgi:hypothetical protein
VRADLTGPLDNLFRPHARQAWGLFFAFLALMMFAQSVGAEAACLPPDFAAGSVYRRSRTPPDLGPADPGPLFVGYDARPARPIP